jgi:hypothetical protein
MLPFDPPPLLRNGLAMTLYAALWVSRRWDNHTLEPEPPYQEVQFQGADNVPLYGWMAIPAQARGTWIGTYGITGTVHNQWFLRILGRKAFAQGFAVVLFDWRGHGQTARLSPALTSDGLFEGEDFVRIAAQAKQRGCPGPLWLTGFSLGGQLALWGLWASQDQQLCRELGLVESDWGGGAVICPNLDAQRSLTYLTRHPLGRFLEQAIARELKRLAQAILHDHPDSIDPQAIERAKSIWGFDHELVIPRLGFASVEEYYAASSPLPLLPQLRRPTLIIYAADDPMFDPALVADLEQVCRTNPSIDLALTQHGGHVGYLSSPSNQIHLGDRDCWWAWNRVLDWCNPRQPSPTRLVVG